MSWLLALLAIFNLISMFAVFTSRIMPRKKAPWAQFGAALLATELAWLWLPLQVLLAGLFIAGGALDHTLGKLALLILLATWPGLVWSIWKSTRAEATIERALLDGLGLSYRGEISDEARGKLRREVSFDDWKKPFSFGHPDVEVLRHIPYGPLGVRQQLDIYRPKVLPEDGCPVLFQIHGGAWMLGDKGGQALPLMYHMASKGWICVAANYRLSPSVGFPTQLLDCKRALCWIRENGAEYGMDTRFVAITGGSAGGHLTALMGLTENRKELQADSPDTDTGLQAVVPFYGVYDFMVRYDQHVNRNVIQKFLSGRVMYETPEQNPALWDLASPVAQVHSEAPPFMVWHGSLDSLASVNDGRVFADRLREVSRNPVVYVELPGAEHAWELLHSLRTEHTVDGVHRFLEWTRARCARERNNDEHSDVGESTAA